MGAVHVLVGFAVVAVFAIGWVWGIVALVRKRPPGERFWVWLTAAQVVTGLQAVVGIVLFAMGRRPTDVLHYVYGFGPVAVLVVAHVVARDALTEDRTERRLQPWVPFAFGSFICFGLTLRALMTGLGPG